MKTHSRCRSCGHGKKLNKHPLEYMIQPKCSNCGHRSWRKDEYRHAVELPMIRGHIGRYKVCHSDCFHFSHRMGSEGCKFKINGEYKDQ